MRHNALAPRATAEFLPSADQDRLARILDDYLTALEQGNPISPEELLNQYPGDADQLRGYLSGLELFHRAAAAPSEANFTSRRNEESSSVPRIIGDFRLVREIGRGGMGVVYEAWQMSLRRLVALKVLPFTAAHDAKQLGRFRNEAQAAAQVQHPNIVPVFAVGEDDGVPFYAMQLIPGQCLAKLLVELRAGGKVLAGPAKPKHASTVNCAREDTVHCSGRQPTANPRAMSAAETVDHVRTVARLAIQAADALHAAHEFGIVHRDVKPSNLLVDEHGQLWITDFGLARCRETDGLTQTGDVLGTMRYMSPEQALGRTTLIDHRTDIYSLGVTLYELATLVHPADGVSDMQLYFDRSRPAIKPLRHWNQQIPLDFQTIVMKSLSEFPVERYGTARELASDLQRFLAGKPILATPPSPATRASKWAKRHRGVLAAALIATFAGLLTHTLLLTRERAARETALARANQSLDHAHAVLDRFGSRLVDQLGAIPGAEGVRHELLQDSFDLYRQFEQQAEDDASLATDLAFAYGKMGSLAEKMGKQQQACDLQMKACRAWEERVAQEPGNPEHLRNLALCENNLAMAFADTDRMTEALKLLHQARQKQVKLSALDANAYALELAATHRNLGSVLIRTSATEQAVKEFKEAVALEERLARTSSENGNVLRGLSASYNRLGAILASFDPDAAVEIYRKAIILQQRLVTTDTVNRLYQGELARTHTNLGFLMCGRKNWRNAELCYTAAIRIQENLLAASPSAVAYRRDLAISYNNLGMVLSRDGRLRRAESSFRRAVRLQRQLLANQPADAQLLSNQGSVLNNLGMLLVRVGRTDDAAGAFREAIQLQKQALDASPQNASFRDMLNRHYVNYARVLCDQQNLAETVATALERKKLWPGQPEKLCSVAAELAAAYQEMEALSSTSSTVKNSCVSASVATLREALAAGLPAERLQQPEFSQLAKHELYRAFQAEVRNGQPLPSATHQAQMTE